MTQDLRTRSARFAAWISGLLPAATLIVILLMAIGYLLYRSHQRAECEARGGHYVTDGFSGWPTCIDAQRAPR